MTVCGFCGERLGSLTLIRTDGRSVRRCPRGCAWWVDDPCEVDYGCGYFTGETDGVGYGSDYAQAGAEADAIRRCAATAGPGATVLEIGAGNGALSIALHHEGVAAIASDVNSHFKKAIEVAGVPFRQLDAVDAVAQPDVDVVVAIDVFEHLDDPKTFLGAWNRGVSEILVLRTPNGAQLDWLGAKSNLLSRSLEHRFYPRPALFRWCFTPGASVKVGYSGLRFVHNDALGHFPAVGRALGNDLWVTARRPAR